MLKIRLKEGFTLPQRALREFITTPYGGICNEYDLATLQELRVEDYRRGDIWNGENPETD